MQEKQKAPPEGGLAGGTEGVAGAQSVPRYHRTPYPRDQLAPRLGSPRLPLSRGSGSADSVDTASILIGSPVGFMHRSANATLPRRARDPYRLDGTQEPKPHRAEMCLAARDPHHHGGNASPEERGPNTWEPWLDGNAGVKGLDEEEANVPRRPGRRARSRSQSPASRSNEGLRQY
jgi:hypothetical protein